MARWQEPVNDRAQVVPGWLGSTDELERGIGVDEIQWHRGQKYQTLVYQIVEGRNASSTNGARGRSAAGLSR
jgi:hypothetical protein